MTSITKLNRAGGTLAVQAMRDYQHLLTVEKGVLPVLNAKDKLIPVDACHAIIERIEVEHVPAGECENTTNAVAFLIGGFPQSKKSNDGMENPKIYLAHVVRIYSQYPAALHTRATDEILTRYKFRPAIAEIVKVFEELICKWVYAQIIADKHIKENDRRKAEAERMELIKSESEGRSEFFERMREQYGDDALSLAEKVQTEKADPALRSCFSDKPRKRYGNTKADLKQFQQDRHKGDLKVEELKRKMAAE